MAATGQAKAYRCEQCGSSEIVALSQLYEQGTRSFSGRFTSGVSQSYTCLLYTSIGQFLQTHHAIKIPIDVQVRFGLVQNARFRRLITRALVFDHLLRLSLIHI